MQSVKICKNKIEFKYLVQLRAKMLFCSDVKIELHLHRACFSLVADRLLNHWKRKRSKIRKKKKSSAQRYFYLLFESDSVFALHCISISNL